MSSRFFPADFPVWSVKSCAFGTFVLSEVIKSFVFEYLFPFKLIKSLISTLSPSEVSNRFFSSCYFFPLKSSSHLFIFRHFFPSEIIKSLFFPEVGHFFRSEVLKLHLFLTFFSSEVPLNFRHFIFPSTGTKSLVFGQCFSSGVIQSFFSRHFPPLKCQTIVFETFPLRILKYFFFYTSFPFDASNHLFFDTFSPLKSWSFLFSTFFPPGNYGKVW